MNKKFSKFQFIVLALFIVFIIAGVIGFATYRGSSSENQLPPVTIWGTFPEDVISQYIAKINITLNEPISVTYVEKSPDQFSADFIAALARGQGPDGILLPADTILPHIDKLVPIPYSALPQRTFTERYITEAQIYLRDEGILAIPFTIDPLIMYWNRDMFDAAGVATYPRTWDEFSSLNQKITVKDSNGNVRRSAIAMGDFTNVSNARELLGTLILQLGNPVTVAAGNGAVSTLKSTAAVDPSPALEFFTQFVNPSDPNYSWNRGMPPSKSAFLSGTLATYFGFASEIADIRSKNPNLNFDAALIPQIKSGGQKSVYGRLYGFSIVRASPKANAVFQVVSILTSPDFLPMLSDAMYLPTVRRDIIAEGSNDAYISIFNEAALVAKTWLDADPVQSRQIFGSMISAITSGQKTVNQALRDAGDQYDIILERAVQ